MTIDDREIKRREEIVASNFRGILPQCEVFYILSIAYSADRADRAFKQFADDKAKERSAIVIASTVHEALGHSAALSRFFWPSRNRGVAHARAIKLREAFNLDDESPLKNRHLRDALEHFDERLDRYLLVHDVGHFFPTPMIGDHTLADEPMARIFKLVDPISDFFVVLDEKLSFKGLALEVERITQIASKMGKTGRLR